MGGISCSLPLLLVAVAIVFIVVQLLNNNNSRVNAKAETRPQKLNGHYEQPQWGIVIDAGSSGSRIHIFRFNSPRDPDGLPLIHWPAAASLKQTPGLSTFAEPLAASRTLHPLLAFAAEHVPDEAQPLTPVFLMATAGMRRIDPDKADAVLEACRQVLQRSSFRFQAEWASIIPGYSEGVFGWAAANYAAGTLDKHDPAQTVGVLELGGASSQVTFAPTSTEDIPKDLEQQVTLGGTQFTLYTHSFLGLGQEAAQEALASAVLRGSGNQAAPVVDPCTPTGYSSSIPTVVGLPRSSTSDAAARVVFAGNFTGCLRAATRLLRQGELHDACESIRCGVGGMPTPRLSGEFLATENFFYTAEFFGLGSRPSLEEVAHAGEKYCAMQWNDVMHLHGPESAPGGEVTASSGRSEPELLKYCFSAAYIVAFLANGWGVDKNEKKVHFSNSVGGVSVDWAVGALLLEVAPFSSMSPAADEELARVLEQQSRPDREARLDNGHAANLLWGLSVVGVVLVALALVANAPTARRRTEPLRKATSLMSIDIMGGSRDEKGH